MNWNQRQVRITSFCFLIIFLTELLSPSLSWALTSGPSQPEVESFTPIGTSDMVDLFSGNFNYNLPLLDIDGYPINLAYNAGVTADQEASWVGLGWNLNTGAVTRNMRGLPDDFAGESVRTDYNLKDNVTIGVTGGASGEFEVLGMNTLNLSSSLGIQHNNYSGYSANFSITPSLGPGEKGSMPFNVSLGISGSSDQGASIRPNLSMPIAERAKTDGTTTYKSSLSISMGGAFNTRAGITNFSVNANATASKVEKIQSSVIVRNSDGKVLSEETIDEGQFSSSTGMSAGGNWSIGMPTFTPPSTIDQRNVGVSGKFTAGPAAFGSFGGAFLQGFYSKNKLRTNSITNPAYGYMYSHLNNDLKGMHDFNRENEGAVDEFTPYISYPNYTYDMYSVASQGMSGSFRPVRSDVGTLWTAQVKGDPDTDVNLEIELGIGYGGHVGGSIGATRTKGESRAWNNNYAANYALKFVSSDNYPLYESVYFKEAGEKSVESDPTRFDDNGSFRAVRIPLTGTKFNIGSDTKWRDLGDNNYSLSHVRRRSRDKRTNVFYYLTNKEARKFATQELGLYSSLPSHHIGEITSMGADGSRYVFGYPIYNNTQLDVSFAVGSTSSSTAIPRQSNLTTGLVEYSHGSDNTINNQLGVDNFYRKVTLPKYSHSHMLTCILSSDYIDTEIGTNGQLKGPSDGDLGSWTKFSYTSVPNYKWRVPLGGSIDGTPGATSQRVANFIPGLKESTDDDRASYTYGVKDLVYLERIETKNYIVIFETSDRLDAIGVIDEGGLIGGDARMRKLDAIKLYSKAELENANYNFSNVKPLKAVHFEYSYLLCPNVPNSNATNDSHGKLTLKEVYFTFQGSFKAKFSSYQFDYAYSSNDNGLNNTLANPEYNLKGYDRWGTYKPNQPGSQPYSLAFSNADYPYTNQNSELTDQYASAWTLKEIKLPSGGSIRITYESDDYAYVQNQRAMRMFPIVGSDGSVKTNTPSSMNDLLAEVSTSNDKNKKLIIELPREGSNIIGEPSDYYSPSEYNKYVFIRSKVELIKKDGTKFYEYVPGYYEVKNFFFQSLGGLEYAIIELEPQDLNDTGEPGYNPITVSGIQFGRMAYSRELLGQQSPDNSGFENMVRAVAQSFASMKEFFVNPNKTLYNQNIGRNIVAHHSFIRLKNQNGHKLGGGHRVKKIETWDNWHEMTNNSGQNMNYGQEYQYVLPNGESSGVATYEPQNGGEENPFKQPEFVVKKRRGVPNERYYQEKPLGEGFFPSPSVGYSRVIVKNLSRENVTRNATGAVAHEFYTAKDFPVIVEVNKSSPVRRDKKQGINNLLKFKTRDHMAISQGICVELNDMHGKQKKQTVYNEYQDVNGEAFISSVEYLYKSATYGDGTRRLDNNAKVIYPNGQSANATIGLFFEIFNDSHEDATLVWSTDLTGNLDLVVLPFPPIGAPVPSVKPNFNSDERVFKFTSTVKIIQRFGLLEKTIATADGASVTTSNLAYDSETGDVLLTEVNNNFGDMIYNLKFPSYWRYPEMGGAYQNIGFTTSMFFDGEGKMSVINAGNIFCEGDEIGLLHSNEALSKVGWVVEVGTNFIKVVDRYGAPIVGTGFTGKIIRSGYRNMQMGTMASITTKTNPLNTIASNTFSNVLQASAIEYVNEWLTNCECFGTSDAPTTTNPYILGIKGYWKPRRSYLYLTDRSQTDRNDNTNLRNDGAFTSFSPYYKVQGNGNWYADPNNWTYTSEVTQFSPFGQETENRDALGRYSAAKFGYNQTHATAVAANSKNSEMGFEGFETTSSGYCADGDFSIVVDPANLVSTDAHTGRFSLRVTPGEIPSFASSSPPDCIVSNCGISLLPNPLTLDMMDINLEGGSSNVYQMSYMIVSGNPQVSMFDGNTIRVMGNSWIINFMVTDTEGNQVSVELTK